MSLAIGLWVLIEEYSEASPEEASSEDVYWRPSTTLNLNKYREARDAEIARYEEIQSQAYDSIILGSELLQTPRGYRG
jgi:hypothetical protein